MQRAWWQGTGEALAAADPDAVAGILAAASPFPVDPAQMSAWQATVRHLQPVAEGLPTAGFFLEFAIPRMGRRADAVIVHAGHVIVVEFKVGAREFPAHARAQAEGYALDLAHFHETSRDVPLVPVLVATAAPPQQIPLLASAAGSPRPLLCLAPGDLLLAIRQIAAVSAAAPLDPVEWAAGAYRPTPTIIEAAQALFGGHEVAEIARAGADNLADATDAIRQYIAAAERVGRKSLVLLTGVPGSGKTLAGLSLATGHLDGAAGTAATYLSGNGPLVAVLQEALLRDHRRRIRNREPFERKPDRTGARKAEAFIQNLHKWRDEYAKGSRPPAERVVIFDEAQRAWTASETARFMAKRGHGEWAQSEPAFLLSVMNRHEGAATVVCLVGEGQEINRGEAGIGAWIEALGEPALAQWQVHASPHLMSPAGGLPRATREYLAWRAGGGDPRLHLTVSMRSFRAAQISDFVAALLAGEPAHAREKRPDPAVFPIFRTRSLGAARSWLRAQRRGTERAGVVASANALRLKPEGLFVKAKVDPPIWFLNAADDIRSSDMLEDAATEYRI
ncbi:DNA/RNA helicase domain-containing protein [Thermaurantiacus sp.]